MNQWAERGLVALVGAAVGLVGGAVLGGAPQASVLPPTACQRSLETAKAIGLEAIQDAMECEAQARTTQAEEPAPVEESAAAATGPAELIPLEAIVEPARFSGRQLRVRVRNNSTKTIDGFRFQVELFDAFNEPASYSRPRRSVQANLLLAESSVAVPPGEPQTIGTWELRDFPSAVKGIVTITGAHFLDNSTWQGSVTQELDPRAPQAEPAPEPAPAPRRSRSAVSTSGPDISEYLRR